MIPESLSDASARAALRFFMSRLDWFRLKCYATMLHLAPQAIQIWGDTPSPPLVHRLLTLVADDAASSAHTWQLRDDTWARTSWDQPGSIPPPQPVTAHAGDRLSAVELERADIQTLLSPPDPVVWMATGQYALPNLKFASLADAGGVPRWCVGTDHDERTAGLKAVGEGVERFALGDFSVAELEHRSANSLEGDWLHPGLVAAYAPQQRVRLGLESFDTDAPEWWVRGDGPQGPAWLPAALVFCPFTGQEQWLAPGYSSSNGAAAHPTSRGARIRAFLELIERDAFMRCYVAGTPPPSLNLNSLSTRVGSLHAAIRRETDRCGAFILTSTLGIGAVGFAAWLDGRVCIGASVGPDINATAWKAMTEALVQLRHPLSEPLHDPTLVRTPEDHGRLYSSTSASSTVRWLLDGERSTMLPTLNSSQLAAALRPAYFHVRRVNNWHIARCIDPRLIQLTFGYDNELLAHRALSAARARNDSLTDPLFPHPFA